MRGAISSRTTSASGCSLAVPARTAVLSRSQGLPAWAALALRQAAELELIDVRLVVTGAGGGARTDAEGGWAFRIYERVDRQLSRVRPDPLYEMELSACLPTGNSSAPTVWDARGRELVSVVEGFALDVVLDFSAYPRRQELARLSRCGVWSIHLGDSRGDAVGPPFFEEMYARQPTCATELHATCADAPETPRILYRSSAATVAGSLTRNRAAAHWRAADVVVRRLGELQREGWSNLAARAELEPARPPGEVACSQPSAMKVLRHLGRVARGAARKWVGTRVFTGQWFIALKRRGSDAGPLEGSEPFEPIYPPHGRFFADPFLLEHAGRRCVFFEDCPMDREKGVIACVELRRDGTLSEPTKVLEHDCHLSYPFAFTWEGEAYMIPETAGARTVELYRATHFPDRWERERFLMRGIRALDSTLLFHEGRFWLFAVIVLDGSEAWDELSLFSSEALDGEWAPHPLNPIVSDARRARPAGRIFEHGGALVRPGQDCTGRYGRAIVLNRIEMLTAADYREVPLGTIEPDWAPNIGGTHCYDRDQDHEVVDGCRRVARWGRPRRDYAHRDGR